MSIVPLLHALVSNGATDLHCKVGSAPRIRVDGVLRKLQVPELTQDDTSSMVDEVLPDSLIDSYQDTHEADFALSLAGVGRFRVNAFVSRGSSALVVRHVRSGAQDPSELGIPDVATDLALEPRGLVIVTGPTGSGKTTTLASMVDVINQRKEVAIVTIEDPIEILHEDKKAVISQREVHSDTMNYHAALRAAMRQDPDVIMIGEMRDLETVRAAITAAETGHLVLATLHTIDARDTINRIVDFFEPHEQRQVRISLAQTLRGIISQRFARATGGGRILVAEVLIGTGRVAESILDPISGPRINDLIREGERYGMQSFDGHLFQLVASGQVSVNEAIAIASDPQDLGVALRNADVIA